MPVTMVHIVEKNQIVATWTNPVIQADFAEAFAFVAPLYKQAKLPIHTIYVASGLNGLPPNALSTYLRNPDSPLRHAMAGIFVVVADNTFIRMIVETAAKLARAKAVYVAPSLEEAVALVAEKATNTA